MITDVSSAAALNAALKAAHAGDTIELASGTYSGILASGLHFATDVTITSKDPTHAAVLTDANIANSNGLIFNNLEFNIAGATATNAFTVNSSQDIHFDHLNVHGSLDGNPQNDMNAILFQRASNISVTNSEFQQVWSAVGHIETDHLTFSGNYVHDIRQVAIRGGGSSNVVVSDNVIRDIYPVAGDHTDAIQFWTTNETTSASNITVSGNLYYRGAGQVAQGVFLRDEVGGLPYNNVSITGNTVIGGMYNGIAVLGGHNVTVDHNTVVGESDMNSWIQLDGVTTGSITNSSANSFITTATDSAITLAGNTTSAQISSATAAAQYQADFQQWSSTHTVGIVTGSGTSTGTGTSGGTGTTGTTGTTGGTGSTPPPTGLTLSGTTGHDNLVGGAGNDTLTDNGGTDTLTGGAGDDLYVVTGASKVVEAAGGGIDTIQTSSSMTLPSNVENLIFTGTSGRYGAGNDLDNQITGTSGGDHLFGGLGADTINGGAGADVITGSIGKDLMIGGTGADVFIFNKGDGADTIQDFGLNGEHDQLDFSALYALGLHPTLTDTAAGVVISFTSGDSVLLDNVHASSLHATAAGFVF